MTSGNAELLKSISESDYLEQVIEYAEILGWLVYHVFETRNYAKRTSSGFPDLVLVKDGRIIFAELKRETGKVSPAQQVWLDALVPCSEVYVWRPSDWETVERVLALPVTQADRWASCSGCGRRYERTGRSAKRGQHNFCPTCRVSTIPGTIQKRVSRTKQRQEG